MKDTRVGFIGLGRMGGGMAKNLAKGGVPLTVFDMDAGAMGAVAEAGAAQATSAAEVASQSDLVFLCLPYAPHVRAAMFEAGGVAEGAKKGLHVVDTSTLNHVEAQEIGADCASRGIGYSDCPISGLPKRADDGSLTIMFGGEAADFQIAKPYLELMGSYVLHCGALGSGQMMKAVNNVIYDINIAAFCEVLPLAVKAGLDPEQVAEVITSGSARSFAGEYFVPRILDGRFDSDFSLKAAYKDIENVQQMALRHQAALPVVGAMTATYRQAMAQGYADEPKHAMVKVYERMLGQEVRRKLPGT